MESQLSVAQALRIAQSRISLVPQGSQWVLHHWSPQHNATHVSHPMHYFAARATASQAKIQEALELIGFTSADAGTFAQMDQVTPNKDWRMQVRWLAKKHGRA